MERFFRALGVWQDEKVRRGLDWYRRVALNEKPARYLIITRIPVSVSLDADELELWRELEEKTETFLELWCGIREGKIALSRFSRKHPNLADLVVELAGRMLRHCNFCRWNCGVDRKEQKRLGTCGLGATTRVASWFSHHGEELVYRGTGGSGTIFFTSCNMRCSFCQNGDISTDKYNGARVDPNQLALMARRLWEEGCHNINWVGGDPSIHLHTILAAIARLGDDDMPVGGQRAYDGRMSPAGFEGGCNVAQLWNSNFFMSDEAMKLLRLVIDVWLPDFKFGPGKCAARLARTPWYWDTVRENLKKVHDWGESMTIRHLVLPNHVTCCTIPILDWLAEHLGDVPINLMDQYHPDSYCNPMDPLFKPQYRELSRRVSTSELKKVYDHAGQLGLPYETMTHERSQRHFFL